MNAPLLYRIASVLLVLFSAGHTLGFLKFKAPTAEGVAVREAMAKVVFSVGGKSFSYDRFYVGFGLFITVSLLFSAFLSWHLGTLAGRNPEAIGALGWAFFVVQLASLVLSWLFFFTITALFSGLVALCVGWATWLVK
jgi:hypothetical protein